MISPLSARVLTATALVCLPALWSAWQGRMPFDAVLSRFLVVQLLCWLVMTGASALLATKPGSPSDEVAGQPRR